MFKDKISPGFLKFIILLLLIIPGNLLSVSLFFGFDLIFGNIFVFLIAFLYGPLPALLAALLSSVSAYFRWGTFLTVPAFMSEALIISLLYRRWKKGNPVDYVILFWLFIGLPLGLLAHKFLLEKTWLFSAMGVARQFLNSLFNASVCGLFLNLPKIPLFSTKLGLKRKLIPAYNLFSSLIIIVLVTTVLSILVLENRSFEERGRRNIKNRLIQSSDSFQTYLNDWQERNQHILFRLSYQLAQYETGVPNRNLQSFLDLYYESLPGFESLYVGNPEGISVAFSPEVNLEGESNIGIDFSDRTYYKQLASQQGRVYSNLIIARQSGEPIVAFGSPVINNGEFKGFVMGGLYLEPMDEMLRKYRANSSQNLTVIDPDGKVIISTRDFKSMELFQTSEDGFRQSLGDAVVHWFPEDKPSSIKNYMESYIYYKSYVPDLNWTLYVDETMSLHGMILVYMNFRNNLIAILFILFMIPLLKAGFSGFIKTLNQLQDVSSYQFREDSPLMEWPESSILEVNTLIRRIRGIFEEQRVNAQLMKEQNRKLSFMNTALVKSEENLRITLDSIGDGVIVSDAEGKVVTLNPVASRLSGWSAESAVGRDVDSLLSLREEFSGITPTHLFYRVFHKGHIQESGKPYVLTDLDGNCSTVTLGASPIRISPESEIRGAVIVIRNISDTRRLEDQLRQAQKMEVVGQLAGGIAHDFNNLLTGIVGLNEMILSDLPSDSPSRESSRGISSLVAKASDLTRKLLAYSRKGRMISKIINIHEMIDETVGILERTIDKNIRIEKKLEAKSSNIAGDPGQIQSVFMNIALNARDAMAGGGVLTFHTGLTRGIKSVETTTGIRMITGAHICITISDTGSGIDAKTLPHIFEPFYTTKEVGKGSGMGLPAVYGAVSEHNGMLTVDSRPGEGTTFQIYFPITTLKKKLYEPEELAIMRGEETILVVDDEEIIRNSLRAILTELGYKVYTAPGGQDGLDLYRDKAREISLVILDAIMEDMKGIDVLKELKKIDPLVRVIVASGDSSESKGVQFRDAGALDFIGKPFTIEDLNNRIRRILNS